MNRNNVLIFSRPGEKTGFHTAAFDQDLSQVETDIFQNNKRIVLIVALLLSLGLWAIIWFVVVSILSRIAV